MEPEESIYDDIYNKYLNDILKINPIKTIDKKNKKIISTCLFIPENPSINNKTTLYITGLIKTIETYHLWNIGKEKNWILRIYIDDMYLSGINKKIDGVVNNVAKNDIANSKQFDIDNYEYKYNQISPIAKNNNAIVKDIKTNINENKLFLKKIITLIYLYIKHIINSTDLKYNNIEIYTFDCPLAKTNAEFLGHNGTFGTIMRYIPLYDKNVDMVFCINGRYPINALIEKMILTWESDQTKQIFTFVYECLFMANSFINLNKYVEDINHKPIEDRNDNDNLLIESINDIFEMKYTLFPKTAKMNFDDLRADIEIKIRKLKETKKSYKKKGEIIISEIVGEKINNILLIDSLLISDVDDILTYNPSIKYNVDNSQSIAGGLFGIKKDCPNIELRKNAIAKLLRYYINMKDKFIFGIDELILRIILAFEVLTYNSVINYISYTHESNDSNKNLTDENGNSCLNVMDRDEDKHLLITNNNGDKLYEIRNIMSYYKTYENNPDYYRLGFWNSKNLWGSSGQYIDVKYESSKEPLTINLCGDNDDIENIKFNILTIFLYMDEDHYLYINKYNPSDVVLNDFISRYKDLFTIINIDTYLIKDMDKLLQYIINHYNKVTPAIFKINKFNDSNRNSNNSNSNSNDGKSGGSRLMNKKKKRFCKSSRKISKNNRKYNISKKNHKLF